MNTPKRIKALAVKSLWHKQRGFTLLEVLVAMVVLSIGLLGLSGLQTSGLRSNHSAFLRSQATIITNDILDRMRANRARAVAGSYNLAYGAPPTGSITCTTSCSATQVAQMDLFEWRDDLARLPAGEGAITVSSAGIAEVKVCWNDSRESTVSCSDSTNTTKLEFVTRTQI